MFYDYQNYDDFEKGTLHFRPNFVSPGTMARDFGVTRQAIHNWIVRDIIDAHRFEGKEGYFIFIDLSEYEKVKSR